MKPQSINKREVSINLAEVPNQKCIAVVKVDGMNIGEYITFDGYESPVIKNGKVIKVGKLLNVKRLSK